MARDDPKAPRQDIRNDRRPIPQKHHSARGEAPRNSGNFTRGSQLLNTQVLMWLQGAKMPLYMWLGIFVIAYSTILSLTLDENNIQLITMRILSGLWDWISFDEMKSINLRLPDDSVRHTYMGYVPYVPEVILAWHKAVKGLMGSIAIASCVTIPLSIWYVDFSARRGKAMIQERHERGAMLVERDLLYSEIAQHNRIEFVKEAAKLFPDKTPEQVLKLKFKARKMGGIHHPYTVAGIPFPFRLEQSHFMTLGTTGSGKTTVFRKLLQEMREREDTAVVFDLTGAYVEAFYDPTRDTILNPADARCPAWSIFNDCRTYSEFTAAAGALIPSDGGAADPFWALAARTLFIEMCMKLIEKGLTSNQALADNLMTADLKLVHKHLANTIADPITAPEAAKMTPRKQIEPLVIPDDIMNLPSLHGFVKFPDGFPAARIRLEWEHYPTVAEGFIERKPAKPDEPGKVVRGGGGKPQVDEDDVVRGDLPGLTDEEVEPANVANTFATNILSQPTENEVDNSRDATTVEATARTEPQVLLQDMRERSGDDDRKDRERSLEGRSVQARSEDQQRQKGSYVARDDRDDPDPRGRPDQVD